MTGDTGRTAARRGGHHGMFAPAVGSFEFTGENANSTDRRAMPDARLTSAARAFLRRVGSNGE